MLTDDQLTERIGTRLRIELAAIEPPADLLHTLHWRQANRARRARAAKLAAVPLVAVTTAVAVTLTLLGTPTASSRGSGITVHELAYRVATAAAAQARVGGGQWMYWREKAAEGQIGSTREFTFQTWSTADSLKYATIGSDGRVQVRRPTCHRPQRAREAFATCSGDHEIFNYTGFGWDWTLPVRYADLDSLPRDPKALVGYLARLPERGAWTQPVTVGSNGPNQAWTKLLIPTVSSTWQPVAPFREFAVIEELLATYVMPPRLTAELYRAVGDIPGVMVNTHAVDVAGRQGVSFTMTMPAAIGGGINEIIFNPHTYQLMGQQAIAYFYGRARVLSGTAILRAALVSGPGAKP